MSTNDDAQGLKVSALSPDGSVRVRLSMDHPAEAELLGPVTRTHTETALAEQARLALAASVRAFRKARRGALGIEEPAGEPETPRVRMRREFAALVEEIAFTEVSPGGQVKVGWGGAGRVAVGIRPGALGRCGRDELAGELAAGVNAALGRFAAELERAHAAVYMPKYWTGVS